MAQITIGVTFDPTDEADRGEALNMLDGFLSVLAPPPPETETVVTVQTPPWEPTVGPTSVSGVPAGAPAPGELSPSASGQTTLTSASPSEKPKRAGNKKAIEWPIYSLAGEKIGAFASAEAAGDFFLQQAQTIHDYSSWDKFRAVNLDMLTKLPKDVADKVIPVMVDLVNKVKDASASSPTILSSVPAVAVPPVTVPSGDASPTIDLQTLFGGGPKPAAEVEPLEEVAFHQRMIAIGQKLGPIEATAWIKSHKYEGILEVPEEKRLELVLDGERVVAALVAKAT